MADNDQAIEALLTEERVFEPTAEWSAQANVHNPDIYRDAENDFESFWAKWASELHWFQPWNQVLRWEPPHCQWFINGKLNAAYNCLDRHLSSKSDKPALLWEGEPGDERVLTYKQLHEEVSRFANVLKAQGIQKGDRVCIYMPMVPELPIAMLACARIGAAHSVVFGGFSAESLRDRINDAQTRLVITADGGWRRGGVVPLKNTVDEALTETPVVEKVIVYKRIGEEKAPINWQDGRDLWWHDLMANASADCPAEPMDAEDMLYILYTSGSTGKPKGIVHTTGGYLTGVYATSKWAFDLKDSDVYWCTADCGWVTGHSYLVYGPLSNGASCVMYEGSPDFPDKDRFWKIIEKYKISIFYTAPTAIRAFMKWGDQYPQSSDLSSLRLLGSVGEPINPEAWMWYQQVIGGGRCPIVDTWWQTETGHILITPLPGMTATKPGSATKPFPGIFPEIVDESGQPVPLGGGGYLIMKKPWPGMLRTILNDDERFQQQYWSRFPGFYFTGDGAKRDEDGYFWLLGRVDDVMNVSGHRISTMEVESALVEHPAVAEAAVIGKNHEIKGQAISAFVIIREGFPRDASLSDELKKFVGAKIGAIARPDDVIITAELPKTRSGKIMRRLLRDVAEGRALGDTTTLADPNVVAALKVKYENAEG